MKRSKKSLAKESADQKAHVKKMQEKEDIRRKEMMMSPAYVALTKNLIKAKGVA